MQVNLDDKLAQDIQAHIIKEYPKEACGIVVKNNGKLTYLPGTNIHDDPENNFILSPADIVNAERIGPIEYIVHSHPNGTCEPSQNDLDFCNKSGYQWIIVSYPEQKTRVISPNGYVRPLIGREFVHGITDCYTIIRDYYNQILNITLPDFPRVDNWWQLGEDLYADNFKEAGFNIVDNIQKHDVILMQFFSDKINHGAVYVGDDLILHHVYNRLSTKEMYNDYWRARTKWILRHNSLLE